MSGQDRAQARHRASSSRVVPAIPLALEARSRRSVEKNALPYDTNHLKSTNAKLDVNKEYKDPRPAINGRQKENIPITAHVNEYRDASESVENPSSQAADDFAGQANGVEEPQVGIQSLPTPAILPSANKIEEPSEATNHSVHSVSQANSLQLSSLPPPKHDRSTIPLSTPSSSTAAPQPNAAPFIPNGHVHNSSTSSGSFKSSSRSMYETTHGSMEHNDSDTTNSKDVASWEQGQAQMTRPQDTSKAFYTTEGPPHYPRASQSSAVSEHLGAVPTNPPDPTSHSTSHHITLATAQAQLPPPPQAGRQSHLVSSEKFLAPPDPKMAFMAAAYMYDHFANDEFADYELLVSHAHSSFPTFSMPAHAVILARSPKLRSMLKQSDYRLDTHTSLKQKPIIIPDPFLTNDRAFIRAIGRLYSGVLPVPHLVINAVGLKVPRDCMQFALSFAAAGHFLEIDEIVGCGVDLANHFLSLETLDLALAFATHGGIGPSWLPRGGMHDGGITNGSSAGGVQAQTTSPPTYGIYSDGVLRNIFRFLFIYIGPDFTFDVTAPQFVTCPRLPNELEHRHTRSSSRFTQIKFGEMHVADEVLDNSTRRTMSSALLTLPYALLKHFLEHPALSDKLGSGFVGELMRDVVKEREARRTAALSLAGSTEPASASDERPVQNLRLIESVEPSQQHPCGFTLGRHRLSGTPN